jgi:hypothetical protein
VSVLTRAVRSQGEDVSIFATCGRGFARLSILHVVL